jgi:hypothetical protein
MKLLAAVAAYVELKQSLGAVFAADRRILRSFGHHLGDLPVDALTPEACRAFCLGAGAVTRFAECKHQTLRALPGFGWVWTHQERRWGGVVE